jgi:hypothetical protein
MRFVDISGFGHSGKSVITDLLREFAGYQVPPHTFEFCLLRIPGGLIDLKHAMVDNWSMIRADAAVWRFLRLVERIGPRARVSAPMTIFKSSGMNYDAFFGGSFSRMSKEYVLSLVDYAYTGEWPFRLLEQSPLRQGFQRVALNLRLKDRFLTTIYLAAPHDFYGPTRKYLAGLFGVVKEESTETMVMHNALEPFSARDGLDMFDDARQIVVQRDPRDIYASTVVTEGAFRPEYEDEKNWRLKASFLNTDSVERFIARQRLYYSKVTPEQDGERVLRLRYEDIVLDYEKSLEKICRFLGTDSTAHVKRRMYFKPELSARNIGLWRKYKNQQDIHRIEEALPGYCFLS